MEYLKSKNFKKVLVITFVVIFLSLLLLLKFSSSFEDWQIFWTAVPPIVAIFISVGITFLQLDVSNEQKNKENVERKNEKLKEKAEREAERLKEKNDRDVEKFNEKVTLTQEKAVDPLVETYEKINSGPLFLNLNDQLFKSLVKIFYRYKAVDKYKSKVDNIDNKNKEDLLKQSLLLEIINHQNFMDTKKKIIEHFPELKPVIETISSSSDKNTSDNSISVVKNSKENGQVGAHNYILGDWVVNEKNANKVRVLIGLSMDKKIIAIYLIDYAEYLEESNRIRFKEKATLYDYELKKDSKEIEKYNDFFKKWTAQNPIMYLNTWEKKNDEEKQEIRDVIKELIEKEKLEVPNLNGKHDILVVKTYKEFGENQD